MIKFSTRALKIIFLLLFGSGCLLFSLGFFLGSESAKRLITTQTAHHFGTAIDYRMLRISWSPLPRIKIDDCRIRTNGLDLSAPMLTITPNPLSLVTSRFPINELSLDEPLLLIRPDSRNKAGKQPDVAARSKNEATAFLSSFFHSDVILSINKGRVLIGSPDAAQLHAENINLIHHGEDDRISLKLSASSPELGTLNCSIERQASGQKFTTDIQLQSTPLSTLLPHASNDTGQTLDGMLELKFAGDIDGEAVNTLVSSPFPSNGKFAKPLRLVDGSFTFSHFFKNNKLSVPPPYSITGELSLDHDGKEFFAQLRGRDISVADTNRFLVPFYSLSPIIKAISDIVQDGEIQELILSAHGASPADLLNPRDWLTEGRVHDGALSIPFPQMALTGVNGSFSVQGDILRVRDAAASYQKSSGTNCSLDMGFSHNRELFLLTLDLEANLLQLPSILRQVLHPGEVRSAISELKNLRGKANGRLMVEKKDGHYATVVDVSRFQVAGRHSRLPYPFSLQGEKLRISNNSAELGEVNAEMRFSGFSELSGKLSWDKQLSYALHIAKGDFGPHLYALLPKSFHLSEQFELNPPFTLHDFTLDRQGVKNVMEVSGTITRDDGELSLDVFHSPEELDIRKLTFHDSDSEARITFNHKRAAHKAAISFDGQLHGSTVANFLSGNTFLTGYIKGYTQMLIDLQTPLKSYVSGQLEAQDLNIPVPGKPHPLTVSRCFLSGSNNNVELTGTTVHWLNSNLTLNGRIFGQPGSVFMKVHADADKIDLGETIKEIQSILAAFEGNGQGNQPDFLGAVQLEADQLIFGNYNWSKVKSLLTIDNKTVTAKIDRAELCGIATLGLVTFSSHDIRLELTPHARPEITDYTIGCLTGNPSTEKMSGLLRINGTLATKGKNSDDLLKNIQGSMDLSVTNGTIHNAGTVGTFTNLFSFLRDKKVVEGELTDLNSNAFTYDSFIVKLTFRDGKLFISEAFVDGQLIDIVATEGEMDLKTRQLDVNLLICPIKPLDILIKYTPIIGHILHGTLIAIPIKISGDLLDPQISALSPSAYGSRALDIVSRTLQAPIKIIQPILE